MSLDQGIQYESGFGFHQQYFPQNHYGSQLNGAYLDNNFSLSKLINNIGTNDNQTNQGFSSSDNFVSDVFTSSFGSQQAPTLQSLVDTFGGFESEREGSGGYSGWPEQSQTSDLKTPIKFPSQLLGQNSGARGSPFPEGHNTETSSLFSNSRLPDFSSQFSNFPGSSPLLSSQSSVSSSRLENCLGLSDISDRLELLSTAPPMISSQGSISPPARGSRDSTPLSWNPIKNISSLTSSLTPSPVMSGQFSKAAQLPKPFVQKEEEPFQSDSDCCQSPQLSRPDPVHMARPDPVHMARPDPVHMVRPDPVHMVRPDPVHMVRPDPVHMARPDPVQLTRADPVSLSPQLEPTVTYRGYNKVKLGKSQSPVQGPAQPQVQAPAPGASWSQIVRTSASKLPSLPSPESPPTRRVTRGSLTPSPTIKEPPPQLVVEEVPPTTNTVDFYRGPKVDPRWPVSQQVFLGPIPMSITWDEIRNVFYTRVQRRELLHFYVQSKPVNEVVYGQVVFDKVALANKIVKEGPVKVRGHLINVTLMKEKVKVEKKK